LKLRVADAGVFIDLLQCVARFVDRAYLRADSRGIRFQSIDPHDFCFVDVFLRRPFFEGYHLVGPIAFCLNTSGLSKILPTLRSAKLISLSLDETAFGIEATGGWKKLFTINAMDEDSNGFPEARRFRYEASALIPAREFSELVKTAASVSNELVISIARAGFSVSAKTADYSLVSHPSRDAKVEGPVRKEVSAFAIASYVRALESLIRRCEYIRIWIGVDKPLKLELIYKNQGVFSFFLSPKKRQLRQEKGPGREGTSLPRITATKLPDFLVFLATSPTGQETRLLVDAGIETSGGDYSRLGLRLGLVVREKGRIRLTKEGELAANIVQQDEEQAKAFLHGLSMRRIEPYKRLITAIKRRPMAPEDLYSLINAGLSRLGEHPIDKQDLSTLLGIATWCGVMDRRMSLYYFEKRSSGDSKPN